MILLDTNVISEPLRANASPREGKRRECLRTSLDERVLPKFDTRILAFDIAAIATAKGFTVASRDTAPFLAAGVAVVNPWEETIPSGETTDPAI